MELTADNLDSMDCRPLGRNTGIEVSPELKKLTTNILAKRAATSRKALPAPPKCKGK